MSVTFNELCNKLELKPVYEQASQLNVLQGWCHDNISRDIHYQGSDAEQYMQYLALASTYLDDFIPDISQNSAQKISGFGDLTALQYAAENGYEYFISKQTLLPQSVLDEGDIYGMTPLHKSAVEGYVYTVQALLEKGASVKKVNAQKKYPLHSALFVPMLHEDGLIERKEQVFNDLLAKAPEILGEHDKDGNTALHLMVTHNFDTLVAQVLDRNPTLALLKNNASIYPVHTAILNHQLGALNLLLDIKGVSDLGDARKRVALHFAARYGSAEMVERCCLASSDVDIRDSENKTPLLWAAEDGNQAALEVLLKNGANSTLSDYQGFTILHYAVIAGNESMVRWIVSNAAPQLLNQVDSEGQSPLFHAQKARNSSIAEFLSDNGAV